MYLPQAVGFLFVTSSRLPLVLKSKCVVSFDSLFLVPLSRSRFWCVCVCACMHACVQVEPRPFCTSVVNKAIQIYTSWWTTPLYVIFMSFLSPSLTQCTYIADCNNYLSCLLDLFPSSNWPICPVYLPVLSISSVWPLPFLYLVPATLPFLGLICLACSICLPSPNSPSSQPHLPYPFHLLTKIQLLSLPSAQSALTVLLPAIWLPSLNSPSFSHFHLSLPFPYQTYTYCTAFVWSAPFACKSQLHFLLSVLNSPPTFLPYMS